MKVAISTDGKMVASHFGRCSLYTIFEIEDGKVINREVIENPGHQRNFLPGFLKEKKVSCIITGGMGRRAKNLFDEYDIQSIVGASGNVDDVIVKFIEGTIEGGGDICEHGSGKHH